MTDGVVVTGLGTVGPYGAGWESLAQALTGGAVPLTEVDRGKGYHRAGSARFAGLVTPAVMSDWLDPKRARRMSLPSRMAVAAAHMALEGAGLDRARVAGPRTAVSLGTAFGPTTYTARLLSQVVEQGPESISPFLFMESVANAHAGQIALSLGARGSNVTITQLEASGVLAVARGFHLVASGAADVALVGAVDEISEVLHAVLDRFGALARADAPGGAERARVFDAERTGCIASEGASVLVLERESAARERGARILARVRAAIRCNDPTATPALFGRGHERLGAKLVSGLAARSLRPADIDRVVSGASGSRGGDRLEARTLRATFGDRVPPVLAPKSVTGEYGGGFLASAVLALGSTRFGATPGFERADPELGLVPYDGARLARPERVLVSSLAAGGAAAWLVLES